MSRDAETTGATRLLGKVAFWEGEIEGQQGPAADASGELARKIASLLPVCVFLDDDSASAVKLERQGLKRLKAKASSVNRAYAALSKLLDERRTLLETLGHLGEVSPGDGEDKAVEADEMPEIRLELAPEFQFRLEQSQGVQDAETAAKLGAVWAYGRRREARRVAVECGVDVATARSWARQVTRFVTLFLDKRESAKPSVEAENLFFVSKAQDVEATVERLDKMAQDAQAQLDRLSAEVEKLRSSVREQMVERLFLRRQPLSKLGAAADSVWAKEAFALRETLWFPLIEPSSSREQSGQAGGVSLAELRERLYQQYDLSLRRDQAGPALSGRLAGGALCPYSLFEAEKAEFLDYLHATLHQIGPKVARTRLKVLPPAGSEKPDARAVLDISRRTAKEVVKMRSLVEAALTQQEEKLSDVARHTAASQAVRQNLSELAGQVLSLRRDIQRLGKSFEGQMRSATKREIIEDFLVIADDLSRIAKHCDSQTDAGLKEALEIVLGRLDSILARHDIRRIKALGERFDPSLHECVGTRREPGCSEGTILEEVSIGYTIGNKILRPAKVIVCQ